MKLFSNAFIKQRWQCINIKLIFSIISFIIIIFFIIIMTLIIIFTMTIFIIIILSHRVTVWTALHDASLKATREQQQQQQQTFMLLSHLHLAYGHKDQTIVRTAEMVVDEFVFCFSFYSFAVFVCLLMLNCCLICALLVNEILKKISQSTMTFFV